MLFLGRVLIEVIQYWEQERLGLPCAGPAVTTMVGRWPGTPGLRLFDCLKLMGISFRSRGIADAESSTSRNLESNLPLRTRSSSEVAADLLGNAPSTHKSLIKPPLLGGPLQIRRVISTQLRVMDEVVVQCKVHHPLA